jgi:nifR3 family TIM-barrel protein
MAGLTNSAYRMHLKMHGAGLVTSEMVSIHGLIHGNCRTREYISFREEERPIAVQLFGDDPELMARAVEIVLSASPRADLIDINMGCPVRKVIRTGAGSALMADASRAVAVASAAVRVADQVGVPVTVKLRSGIQRGEKTAEPLARSLEEAGVAGLCVHPRAAVELYRGQADHTVTAVVVAAVYIPVIASGDINSVESARRVIDQTGAAAVMVARGAAGNPWLVDSLVAGEPLSRPPLCVVVADLLALLTRAAEDMGSQRAARWARKLIGWYLRPSKVPAADIERIRALPDVEDIEAALRILVRDSSLVV